MFLLESGLGSFNFFVPNFKILHALLFFHFVGASLHLVRLLVIFSLAKVSLYFSEIEKLSGELKGQGECLFQVHPILLQLLIVPSLQLPDLVLVLLFLLLVLMVVLLVELLVLLLLLLLDVLHALLVRHKQRRVLHVKRLILQLLNPVHRNLGL